MSDENIVENLKNVVQSIIAKTGSDSNVAQDLIKKIQSLQDKLESLSSTERLQFVKEMKDSIQNTIETVERKLLQHAQIEKAYNYSNLSAVIFIFVFIFALFGYKLYKSLMEKELKKQEKLKNKQSKKAKKQN